MTGLSPINPIPIALVISAAAVFLALHVVARLPVREWAHLRGWP